MPKTLAKAKKKPLTRSRNSSINYTDRVTDYANAVISGAIVAGPHVRDACKRHLKDLKDGQARGLTFGHDAARRAYGFFEKALRLNSGQFEGKPFTLLPWQGFVVGSIFGWKRTDGTRRFRVAYIETGKGSGKSPLAAGIGLRLMFVDNEPRAEVYAAATKQEQAGVLFRDAVAMVKQSPELGQRLMLSGGTTPNNIAHIPSGSYFRPISSERQGRGQSGPKPHCVLLDEVHEHPTNAMVEFLSAGVKSRRQPLVFMITNSGCDRMTVCWEYHTYSVRVASGDLKNDEFFSYVCALDPGEDPMKDEACWIKVNPSLPLIPGTDYLRAEVVKAKGMTSKELLVRRLNFCEWTDAADGWIGRDIWQGVQATLDLDSYAGRECYGGLDLALSSDLAAFVLVFPGVDEPTKYDLFSWFWMPGDRLTELENRDSMSPFYRQWRDEGHLFAPAGARVIDFDHMATHIHDITGRFKCKGIAYDRAKIEHLTGPLERAGSTVELVPHGQGFFKAQGSGLWMPYSIEQTEAALQEARLRVNENPVMTWNVSCCVTQASTIQPSDRYFSKGKTSGRIDGAVAMVQAIGLATKKPGLSFWEVAA